MINIKIFTIFTIFTIFAIILLSILSNNSVNQNNELPYLFVYWQNKPNTTTPPYIQLCIETIKLNSAKYFKFILLDELTINHWLKDLRKDIFQLPYAQFTDYIRIALLYKYGGIWLDADTIVMNDMKKLYEVYNGSFDYIGFGCTGKYCTFGKPEPSNQAMGAKKGSELLKNILKRLDDKFTNYFTDKNPNKTFGYFDFGKYVIWEEIKLLQSESKLNYYHFDSSYDGSRNNKGEWIVPQLITTNQINFLNEKKIMLVFLANSWFCGDDPNYNWFCKLTIQEILNSDFVISNLFKKALKNQSNIN